MGRNPIIHREKLFGGRETAEEVNARIMFGHGAKCGGCGGKPAIRIQVFAAIADLPRQVADSMKLEIACGLRKAVPLTNGAGVRTSLMYACGLCAPRAEKVAARGPSWAVVVIDRGPGADKPIVSVTAPVI